MHEVNSNNFSLFQFSYLRKTQNKNYAYQNGKKIINGNSRTDKDVILHELILKNHDTFNSELLTDSIIRLKNIRLFSIVELTIREINEKEIDPLVKLRRICF